MRIHDLKQIEVINECECKKLGYVTDMDFDICTGDIKSIVVACSPKVFGILFFENEYVIPRGCIKQIGQNIIIINAKTDDLLCKCKH